MIYHHRCFILPLLSTYDNKADWCAFVTDKCIREFLFDNFWLMHFFVIPFKVLFFKVERSISESRMLQILFAFSPPSYCVSKRLIITREWLLHIQCFFLYHISAMQFNMIYFCNNEWFWLTCALIWKNNILHVQSYC